MNYVCNFGIFVSSLLVCQQQNTILATTIKNVLSNLKSDVKQMNQNYAGMPKSKTNILTERSTSTFLFLFVSFLQSLNPLSGVWDGTVKGGRHQKK